MVSHWHKFLSAGTAFAFSVGAVLSGHAAAGEKTLVPGELRVCMFPDFPPVVNQAPDGTWQGHDVDFLRRFAADRNLTFTPIPTPEFSGIWRRPGAGDCDIAASGITRTGARMAETPESHWSKTYRSTARSLLVRRADSPIETVSQLAGKRILAVFDSTAHGDLMRRAAAAGVSLDIAASTDEKASAEAVATGEAFGFALGEISAESLAEEDPRLTITWLHPFLAEDGSESYDEFSFVVRKADTGLAKALDKWIAAQKDSYGR